MSLLREIQASLMQQDQEIGPILLKLRFLASRLGSGPLEEWVKHEAEGYPSAAEVPDYRKIGVSYTGTFFGPFGSSIQNAPIPPYLIETLGGKKWTTYEVRQSISGIDHLVGVEKHPGRSLQIEAANLMLLLQGKVYKNYACNSVVGTIPMSALVEIQNAVRTKVLELTIELEKSVPTAAQINLGPAASQPGKKETETVTHITQQIVHGNVTTISSSGESAILALNIGVRDENAFAKTLAKAGIAEPDADEFAKIVASEEPESKEEPFGVKAKTWIVKNISKAADGTWKVGIDVATKVMAEAAMKYYGLK